MSAGVGPEVPQSGRSCTSARLAPGVCESAKLCVGAAQARAAVASEKRSSFRERRRVVGMTRFVRASVGWAPGG